MLNELKIRQYCDKYKYEFRCFQYDAIIMTGIDLWKLEFEETYDNMNKTYKDIIKVKHQNKCGNKTKKNHFHTQRIAYDIDYVFNNIIIPHEQGNRVYQKAFKIKDILVQNI